MEEEARERPIDVGQRLRELRMAVPASPQEASEGVESAPAPPPTKLEQLEAVSEVEERPFESAVPVVGPLIARLRQAWNNVSTTWYVRPILQQQNEFNHLIVQHLQALASLNQEIDARLIDNDRDGTALARQMAEISAAISGLEKQLLELEQQLIAVEEREE